MKHLSFLTLFALLTVSACSHCKSDKSCCSKDMKDCTREDCKKKN